MRTILLFYAISISAIAIGEVESSGNSESDFGLRQCSWMEFETDQIYPDDNSIRASANSVLYIEDHSTTLVGDAKVSSADQELKASFLTLDAATKIYTAEGEVSLDRNDFSIIGEKITGNLEQRTADVEKARFVLKDSILRGSAKTLHQEGRKIRLDQGRVTSCGMRNKTWELSSRSITIDGDKSAGSAKNTLLKIKGVPIGYMPYIQFPIGEERKSGFLWPALGHNGNSGTDIAIPYYFNISPSKDATYSLRNIAKRGIIHEGEFRFMTHMGKNAVAAGYLPRDKEYKEFRNSKDDNLDASRDNDRWLVHLNHRGRNGPWSSILNYTNVSDIYYFEDLGDFSGSNSDFNQLQNRRDASALLQTGSISYLKPSWRANLEFRKFKSLEPTEPRQYEILPRLTLNGHLTFGPLLTSAFIQATEFDRRGDEEPKGRRFVFDANASASFRKSWGFISPAFRVTTRHYNYDDRNISREGSTKAQTYQVSLDSGLTFERQVSFFGKDFYQTLEPRAYFLYSHEKEGATVPIFDSILLTPGIDQLFRNSPYSGFDKIGNANQLSSAIKTTFMKRNNGKELFSASVGRVFYFDGNRPFSQQIFLEKIGSSRSPIFFTLTASLNYLDIVGSYERGSNQNKSNRGYLGFRYRGPAESVFSFNYAMNAYNPHMSIFNYEEEETDIGFSWPLTKKLRIMGRWNYGLSSDQTLESLFGFRYEECCWSVRLVHRKHLEKPRFQDEISNPASQLFFGRMADTGIYFEFELKGLASLGNRMNNLLRHSIIGLR